MLSTDNKASPTLCVHPVIPEEHYILLYDVDIYPPGQGHGHSCYRVDQKKGRSQNIIVFHELLSLGCINFKNLCAHHEEEVLRFPKHPQLVKFG